LSAPSQASTGRPAAGAQPPAEVTTATAPVESAEPTPPDTGSAPPVPAVSASKAKAAIRSHVRGRVASGAKLALRNCATAGTAQYRCQVRATKRNRVWKGIATATLSPTGTYTVAYRKR